MLILRIAKKYQMLKDRNLKPPVNDNLPTAGDLAKQLGEVVTPTVPQNQLDLKLAVTSDLPYTSKHAVKSELAATSELNTKFGIVSASNVADTTNLAVISDLSSTPNIASKSKLTPKSNLAAV